MQGTNRIVGRAEEDPAIYPGPEYSYGYECIRTVKNEKEKKGRRRLKWGGKNELSNKSLRAQDYNLQCTGS